ncbi:hypothetical protein C5167_013528 [Papaver somniferum]|uniref:Uncharacterized protein n=1 Tax=Papaver somniferum TaxID=3469 RepID=A0A4Y7J0L2_PAPSO|nr:hypothetical protein C5167_013528 [Papaver somniferum]
MYGDRGRCGFVREQYNAAAAGYTAHESVKGLGFGVIYHYKVWVGRIPFGICLSVLKDDDMVKTEDD